MKRQVYDLTDDPLIVFVNKIGQVLRDEKIPHNIVGGVAAQAHILNMLVKKHEKSAVDLIEDKEVRVHDYIRKTDDVNIALNLEGENDKNKIKRITEEILPQFNFIEYSPDEKSILEFEVERTGASRPKFNVYADAEGSTKEVIAMNIGRQPKDIHKLDPAWYMEFINQGNEIIIPYLPYLNGSTLRLHVPRLEHLLASKISQSRDKDLIDNKNLASLAKDMEIELDFSEISRILLPKHQDNYNRFLSAEYPGVNKHLR